MKYREEETGITPTLILPHQRLCHNLENYAHWCFCHSGLVADCRCLISYSQLDPESSFFKVLRYWMPDQVRHDRYKLNAY